MSRPAAVNHALLNPHDIDQCMGPHPAVDDPVLLAVLSLEQHGPLTLAALADELHLYDDSRPYRFEKFNRKYHYHQREDKARHLIVLARARGHAITAQPHLTGTVFVYRKEHS